MDKQNADRTEKRRRGRKKGDRVEKETETTAKQTAILCSIRNVANKIAVCFVFHNRFFVDSLISLLVFMLKCGTILHEYV